MTILPECDRDWLLFDLKVASHAARVSTRQLLAAARIPQSHLEQPTQPYDAYFVQIWSAAERLSGRPEIGAEAIHHLKLDNLGDFGLATLTSVDFSSAIDALVKFSATITSRWLYTLEQTADLARVCFKPIGDPLNFSHHCVDTTAAIGVFLARLLLANCPYTVQRVNFRHPDFGRAAAYEEILGSPCRFDQDSDSVEFAKESMCHPMPMRNAELNSRLRSHLQRQLPGPRGIRQAALAVIRECLTEQQIPSRRDVAQRMGLGERTLLRRLQRSNTNFRELLDSCLEEQARFLLSHGFTAEAVAEKLGYAGSAPLARMLKRRTGKGVRELRLELGEGAAS